MRSYTSHRLGPVGRLRELVNLVDMHTRSGPARAEQVIVQAREMAESVERHSGMSLNGLRMLDVGCGQSLRHALYFAQENEVVGIDDEVVPRSFHPGDYYRMFKSNGAMRVAKTVARKLLGTDREYRKVLAARFGTSSIHQPTVLRMDAASMEFDDASFDFAYSISVFEHLADPRAVIGEVARVLRNGGVAYLSPHLYTSESGAHDPRIMSGNRNGLPFWAHLRPQHESKVRSNAYLNKIRLEEWKELFADGLPGCTFELVQPDRGKLEPELRSLREQGELAEYSDDELLTTALAAIWEKA